MSPGKEGSIRLFTLKGINVYVHWSWLVIAALEFQYRMSRYGSPFWNVVEYLTLFGIVLLHEFGHSLASRQVGGHSDEIVLWPLGGIAYVNCPPRPGANLWSIAAGPLVNVVILLLLIPVLYFVVPTMPYGSDLRGYLQDVWVMNYWLLLFNILPIYPLDGGQMLHALLWFRMGRARSLYVATIIGFIGIAALGLYAYQRGLGSLMTLFMLVFLGMNCRNGFLAARELMAMERAGRRPM